MSAPFPIVSICLPNLNGCRFLRERLDTILAQTLTDWELIVVDNFSDDGAWEFFVEQAGREPRMRVSQAPRAGMYANWNNCIRQARGKYVYIATSDDTMAPDLLEMTVGALEEHPECDLAHVRLKVVGEGTADLQGWWETDSIFARSCNGLSLKTHTRLAPFDGLLHLSGETVYTSITQLLVRRELFDRVGLFEAKWGSVGDFNWCMRAGLTANTVHVPQTWGGWRIHDLQATASVDKRSPAHASRIDEMIDHALETCAPLIPPSVATQFQTEWVPFARDMRRLVREAGAIESAVGRGLYHLRKAVCGSRAAIRHISSRLAGRPVWPETVLEQVRAWLAAAGIQTPLLLDEGSAAAIQSNTIPHRAFSIGRPVAVDQCPRHKP